MTALPYFVAKRALDGMREERVLKKLQKLGAISPETAKSPEEAKLTKKERKRLSSLVKRNKVRKTGSDTYYIPREGNHC